MILVSACLLGHKVKYNGEDNKNDLLKQYDRFEKFIAVCPECLGLLSTPRLPVEIQGGHGIDVLAKKAKVVGKDNGDITENFLLGAKKVLTIAKQYNVKYAIFKERSPSCGVKQIYDGSFTENKINGYGVCTALLLQNNIQVISDEEITEEVLQKILKF